MNILFLSHIWPPAIDGGSQILFHSQQNLEKLGHKTLVLATNCQSTDDFINPTSNSITQHNGNIVRLPIFKTKLLIYLKRGLKKFFNFELPFLSLIATGPIFKPFRFLKAIIQIVKFKPNLIMAGPFPTTITPIAIFFKKITNAKLLVLPCFHQYDQTFQNKILLNRLKQADYVWALTNHERKYLKHQLSHTKTKVFTLYPGISTTFFKPIQTTKKRQTINLLFLGNLAAHKKINLLLSAFKRINQVHPHTRLAIVGQKTLYYPQITKHLKTIPKKIAKNIKLIIKKYTATQAKQYLNRTDIFINPSVHESFGLVFIEAMSQGVPIVGSNIPPVAEIINTSQAGLIFKKNNLDDLVSKIEKLIRHKKLRYRLSSNGIKFAKSQNWPQVTKTLINEI